MLGFGLKLECVTVMLRVMPSLRLMLKVEFRMRF